MPGADRDGFNSPADPSQAVGGGIVALDSGLGHMSERVASGPHLRQGDVKRKGADLLVAPLKLNVRLSKCGPRRRGRRSAERRNPLTQPAPASRLARRRRAPRLAVPSWLAQKDAVVGGVEADAVVGHAVLGLVVGADLLGTVAVADLALALGTELGLLLLELHLVQTGTQHLHADLAVLDLGALLLRLHHGVGGQVW